MAIGDALVEEDMATVTLDPSPFHVALPILVGNWHCFTIDLGTNLGSSIQSIALYLNTDYTSQAFLFSSIIITIILLIIIIILMRLFVIILLIIMLSYSS